MFTNQLERVTPLKLVSFIQNHYMEFIQVNYASQEAKDYAELLFCKTLVRVFTSRRDALYKKFKLKHGKDIENFPRNEAIKVDHQDGFTLRCKVGTARTVFDKDAFMKAVSEKYHLPISELYHISRGTMKTGAAPVLWEVEE
jgi:hypothetical protein